MYTGGSLVLLALSIAGVSSAEHVLYSDIPWKADYGDSPKPWKIDVDMRFMEAIKHRVSLTRLPVDIEQQDRADGPSLLNMTNIRDYWINDYEWSDVQNRLNERFNHFTTTVKTGPGSSYKDPVPLHFIHHKSSRKDAIPLMFFHGWPGSFLEFENIIDLLTSPPNESDQAFHVVVPSIPGFGFSPAPKKPGFGNREVAHAFNALMHQIGYKRYVVQGGDLGNFILHYIAGSYPDSVVSAHSNFWPVPPNPDDWQRFAKGRSTDEEKRAIEILLGYTSGGSGYRFQLQSRPMQLAVAMTDSPVGLALYYLDGMLEVSDGHSWTAEEIISFTLMTYLQGPVAGFRMYIEGVKEGSLRNAGDAVSVENFANGIAPFIGDGLPFVRQPVAISEFPKDIWSAPLDWAKRRGNIVQRKLKSAGGHFAAFEVPELLAEDLQTFFGNAELSKTGEFKDKPRNSKDEL